MSVRLFFAGDLVVKSCTNGQLVSPELQEVIGAHDVACCNFEAPVKSNAHDPIEKVGPVICQSNLAPGLLAESGFGLVSLANNHIMDYGPGALNETCCLLRDAGVRFVGAGCSYEEAYGMHSISLSGVTVGFCAYSEWGFGALNGNGQGFAWIHHGEVTTHLRDMRKRVDFLIVQVHAGTEMMDIPLPQWRQCYRELIEIGVDAVIGHHPHVPQGYEYYREKPICYSLGNFFFESSDEDPRWRQSYAVSLQLKQDREVTMDIIPLEVRDNLVCLSMKDKLEYERELCDILSCQSRYSERLASEVRSRWQEVYRKYYALQSLDFLCPSIVLRSMKWFLEKLLHRKVLDPDLMLAHNIRIESHRYLVENYLEERDREALDGG